MVTFLLIKNDKNIAVIINASNSSSDLYFGHFAAKFFFTKLNTGLLKVVLNFIYY